MRCTFFTPMLLFALGIVGNPDDNKHQASDDGDNESSPQSTTILPSSTTETVSSPSTLTSEIAVNVVTKSVGGGVSFTAHIPSSGSSNLHLQINAPSSMSWVALGQGSRMQNSNMFIIYSNAAGTNVTLSPRHGTGNSEPTGASSSSVTLLAGSGISNGVMNANILCTNCQSWTGGSMSYTSTSAPFIWAYKLGSSIASDSKSARLTQHDSYDTLNINLIAATGSSSSNPPTNNPTTSSSSSSRNESNDSVSGENKSSVSPGFHGTLGVLSFVALFPLGVIVLRLFTFKYVLHTHVLLQLLSYVLALATLATGILLANSEGRIMESHALIGIIVIAALVVQPFLGYAHHVVYKRRSARGQGGTSVFTASHVWWGRLWITLGIVNGALGLNLSGHGVGIVVAYGVVAGIIWLVWVAIVVRFNARRGAGRLDKSGGRGGNFRMDEFGTDNSGGEGENHGNETTRERELI